MLHLLHQRGLLALSALSVAAAVGSSMAWLILRWRRRPVTRLLNVKDYEAEASRKLPRALGEWIAEGAADGITLNSNEAAWSADGFELMPRGAVDVSEIDLRTTCLSHSMPWPVICAPVSHAGELASARAAAATGTVFVASHAMSHTIEEVAAEAAAAAAAAGSGPARLWHQFHFLPTREGSLAFVRRVEQAGFGALVVTIDGAVEGLRERSARAGFTFPRDTTWAEQNTGPSDAFGQVSLRSR
jgi:isopentenyl diphosphate isomerase/L-lactate dehydrogenase-like FMN-dependent dehydrogenase